MRMTRLFSQTLRETPAEAEQPGHGLLLRAGFIRPLAAGIYSYLPLARRSLTKIENIIRYEIDQIGGQEITMPLVNPADLWKESGRWYAIGSELTRFKDKNGRDMVLAMTNEEVVADLVRHEVRSYRQLPQLLYHIQLKWRDDPRPRAGLVRVREFTMKDSYSLDATWDGLDRQYRRHYQAYFNIFNRCGLPGVIAVKADTGIMGGLLSHEYMYLTASGEDTLLLCDSCGYAANRQVARFQKPPAQPEAPRPLEKVATPGVKTIEDLAAFLGIAPAQTAKAVFLVATCSEGTGLVERFIFAVVRGDMEVNETKLAHALGARDLRPAAEDEISATGAVPGYASPLGLTGLQVIVDDAVPASPNLAAGANQSGFHLLNTNYGRDYTAQVVADIAAAAEGSACPECGQPMRTVRGVEVGNIFKLGTRFSEALGCTFIDQDGQVKPVIMGSYGIGSGRLLACLAEAHHDEHGLVWPVSIAPYHVHLVVLPGKSAPQDVVAAAERLYSELSALGIEVLYDDRPESPGIKFNDADLIGLPLRLTVAERSLAQGGLELKHRSPRPLGERPEREIIPLETASQRLLSEIQALQAELEWQVKEVEYIE